MKLYTLYKQDTNQFKATVTELLKDPSDNVLEFYNSNLIFMLPSGLVRELVKEDEFAGYRDEGCDIAGDNIVGYAVWYLLGQPSDKMGGPTGCLTDSLKICEQAMDAKALADESWSEFFQWFENLEFVQYARQNQSCRSCFCCS